MIRRSHVLVSLSAMCAVHFLGVGAAFAHDPIIFTDTQTTPEAGPLLPDGTISFALYGSVSGTGDTRGLRVQFAAGDSVDISLLIPDLAPENAIGDAGLPTLQLVAPDGATRLLIPTEHVRFDEPFSKTSYVRLLELHEPAQPGEYRLTIAAASPSRFTLAVGTVEQFGTPVENVPNRADGSAGVQQWYVTPPSAPVSTVPTSESLSPPSTSTETSTSTVSTVNTLGVDSTPAGTSLPLSPSSTSGPIGLSRQKSGTPFVPIAVITVLLIVAAVLLRWRKRSGRAN
jgi:hypothetical protein